MKHNINITLCPSKHFFPPPSPDIAFVRIELVCVCCQSDSMCDNPGVYLGAPRALFLAPGWPVGMCLGFSHCCEPPSLHFNICVPSHHKSLLRILPRSNGKPVVLQNSPVPMHFTVSATHLTQQLSLLQQTVSSGPATGVPCSNFKLNSRQRLC